MIDWEYCFVPYNFAPNYETFMTYFFSLYRVSMNILKSCDKTNASNIIRD